MSHSKKKRAARGRPNRTPGAVVADARTSGRTLRSLPVALILVGLAAGSWAFLGPGAGRLDG